MVMVIVWKDIGFHDIRIAINPSVGQFRQADLLAVILNTLEDNGLQPRDIDIELTESIVMSDSDGAIETLHRLREAGFHIAVDDFGVGYSSIGYLWHACRRLAVTSTRAICSAALEALPRSLRCCAARRGFRPPPQSGIIGSRWAR